MGRGLGHGGQGGAWEAGSGGLNEATRLTANKKRLLSLFANEWRLLALFATNQLLPRVLVSANQKKSRIDVFYHRFGNGIPGHTARAPP